MAHLPDEGVSVPPPEPITQGMANEVKLDSTSTEDAVPVVLLLVEMRFWANAFDSAVIKLVLSIKVRLDNLESLLHDI